MADSTHADWMELREASRDVGSRTAERMLDCLRSLEEVVDGFAVTQLEHCLQTATRARRAGADDEVVFAALMHDAGKAISVANHPAIAAEMIRPYVRPELANMIAVHQDFEGRHFYGHVGGDPDARRQHKALLGPTMYALAEQFADEWDSKSFDPNYPSMTLDDFEPLVRRLTATHRPTIEKVPPNRRKRLRAYIRRSLSRITWLP